MENIYKKIVEHQSKFSKGLLKVADYMYKDPQLFAMNSATKTGKTIGVSETTVIRFANQLGYSGYSALQKDILEQLFEKSSLTHYPVEKMEDSYSEEPIKKWIQKDIQNIQRLLTQLTEPDLDTVVQKILKSDSILVSGVRSSFAYAHWFAFALDLVKGNTRLHHSGSEDILLRVSELTEESVFVAFSFHRYAKETVHIAKLVKQHGSTVIAFTDSPHSPITQYADLVIPALFYRKSTLDITPVVFSILNSIVSSVSIRNSNVFQQRIKKFDAMDARELFTQGYFKEDET